EGVLQHIRSELQDEGVGRQDEQETDREHERQPQRRKQRREHRVQRGHHTGYEERAAGPRDVDPGQDRRSYPERRRRQHPRQRHAERLEARPFGFPGNCLSVRAKRWQRRHSASSSARFASFLASFFSALFSARCSFCSATLTFASLYAPPTSTLPPVQPKTDTSSTSANTTFQAV